VLAGDGHEDRAYDVTGPESLSAADLAGVYADLAGRPVEPVAVDDDALVAGMVGDSDDGHLAFGARFVASFGRAIREGWFAEVSDDVETLTGRRPRSVRDVLAS
jgi:NAD(P)H dehydrogenase (quinone)